jgi:hypothetical protein
MTPNPIARQITLPPHLGGTASIDGQGNIEFDGTRIHTVGIRNLAEVVGHTIVAIVGSISHHIQFNNGGELYYVFNQRGELVELRAEAVCFTISPEGDYLFQAFEPEPDRAGFHP